MSGTLGLGTPWTRALFPGDKRAEAEALIPAGFQINVAAVNGSPGPWHVRGYRVLEGWWSRNSELVLVMEWTTHSPAQMVAVMSEHLAEMAVRVETWKLADDMSVSVGLDYTGDAA